MDYSQKELLQINKAGKFHELPSKISDNESLKNLSEIEIPKYLKENESQDLFVHRRFRKDEFWRTIPSFEKLSLDEFCQLKFQNKYTVRKVEQLEDMIRGIVDSSFLQDVKEGIFHAPMNLSVSPYILSLIDWNNPYEDPLRIQFIPVMSQFQENHPQVSFDSLDEQSHSPVSGLVHRYHDKALFLPLDVCPVYCRFCTRSYAIGGNTQTVDKIRFNNTPQQWKEAFAYIASRPEIEDIVISGGDNYMLVPDRLRQIGLTLLDIPHIRRIRFASKGPAVMPMKILYDEEWTNALIEVAKRGRDNGKDVVFHTHFNNPNEITQITYDAMFHLFSLGVRVRNQSVLIRGVNDTPETMIHLVKKLSYMNVQPYYVYQHDMVPGAEDMRTSVRETIELEKIVRGVTAGYNTPLFITDTPGGGGKRDVHSYEYYDELSGICVYRSPSIDSSRFYLYFDPLNTLTDEGRNLWNRSSNHEDLINEVIQKASR